MLGSVGKRACRLGTLLISNPISARLVVTNGVKDNWTPVHLVSIVDEPDTVF